MEEHGEDRYTAVNNLLYDVKNRGTASYIVDSLNDLYFMQDTRAMSIEVNDQYFLLVKVVPEPLLGGYLL